MLPRSQMAIQLTLLLISCSLYSMYSSSSFSTSSSLALLVLVISTCLSLLFSNLRQLMKTSSHKTSMEVVAHQEKSTVPQDGVSEDSPVDSAGSLSGSSDCQVSEEGTDEVSVSDDDDDESLIEISLVDGYYVGQEEQCLWKKEQDLLAGFLPEFVLDRRDFIDILSEISEEENMIEIDIARGSIKCANFGVKA
ncbi:hypothetical protein CFC21_012362 [Triticum aestivum]|uniref:Uncharacterized protein n=5 Tax=Triticinae TaxID=1648030 RepID=A0A452Z4W0_AEGTS|nr:uncharacterized protein LOC109780606 [Aegilops tauschii subsp. strangulata]XP_044450441.1 uncharacterized protein LOC123182053 [Triticum aestivum]KAF6995944.1 hypothetical protein CFC21_012362 [Triticum aestivum]